MSSSAAGKSIAIILGAGPGTGAAIGSAFAKAGHAVALLARGKESLDKIAKEIREEGGIAEPFVADASNRDSLKKALDAIKQKFPEHKVKIGIFNAISPFIMKPFLDLTAEDVQGGIDINFVGAFHFSQLVLPLLLAEGGALIFSGATASLKGGNKLAAFSTSKFALRSLSQSLAREFGPQGVHVAHVILDGIIDTPRTRGWMPDSDYSKWMKPEEIAQAYVDLANQSKSAWSQEIDLRPYAEKF